MSPLKIPPILVTKGLEAPKFKIGLYPLSPLANNIEIPLAPKAANSLLTLVNPASPYY